jgi:phosphoribosylformimino-5-aminoimidazole carboxamide ribotide isomerase
VIIFPAIDLRHGRCVRLIRGDIRDETVYSKEPVSMAKLWQGKGAQWLHVVDLDGAITGEPRNLDHVFDIVRGIKIPVQFGGGVRDFDTLKAVLDKGVQRVILGTSAAQDERFLRKAVDKYGDRIVVGVDAKDGLVALRGWVETSKLKAVDFARQMQALGVGTIIYTDIKKDGMLQGPNVRGCRELVHALKIPVIASGGVTTLRDIERLRVLEPRGLAGAIIGKALYSGAMDLKDAIKVASASAPRPGKPARKGAAKKKA